MNDKIKDHIELLFLYAPKTQKAFELKEELLSNSEERYQDLIASGLSPEEAFQNVVNSIGNVSELFQGLGDYSHVDTHIPYEVHRTVSPVKIIIFIFAILFSVSMLSFGIISLVRINTRGMSPSPTSIFKETKLVNTQSISLDDINTLSIEFYSEDVIFYSSDTNELVLKEYMNFTPTDDQLAKINHNGNHVAIKAGNKNFNTISFGTGYNGRAEIYLPSSYHGDLKVTTSSGDIDADLSLNLSKLDAESTSGDIFYSEVTANEIILSTSSGSMKLDSMKASSDFEASSTSGDITIKDVYSEDIAITTSSGSVTIQKAEGDREISSTSGDIKILDGTGDSTVSASSGNITIDHSSDQFELKTNSGDIKMLDSSGGGSINTSSGSITLEYLKNAHSNIDDLELSSTSGDVTLMLPSSLAFEFTADTTSGDIETSFDDSLGFNKRGNHASGTIGSNSTIDIQINTSSGNVKVK